MTPKNNQRILLDFFTSLLLLTISYRLFFICTANEAHSAFTSFHYGTLLLGGISDLVTIGIISGLFLVTQKYSKSYQVLLSYLLLFAITVIYAAHKKIFLILYTGLTYALFIGSFQQGFFFNNYTAFMSTGDWIFILSSFAILTSVRFASKNFLNSLNAYVLLPVMLMTILGGLLCFVFCSYNFKERNAALYSNPLSYMAIDQFNNITNSYYWRKDQPSPQQMQSIALIDPSFVTTPPVQTTPMQATAVTATPWNIVLIILESVGSTHIFEANAQHPSPMPFLQSLARQGLWLNNNYTTGNSSPLGGFGILTGLYANPTLRFSVRPDIRIPTITHFLDKQYDKTFITASVTQYYFPEHLVKNGFNHFYDGRTIPHTAEALLNHLYLQEEVSTDFFLSFLKTVKSPFIATYWSGAAHFPYFDYGKQYQLVKNNPNNSLSLYINNLNLLDQQIKRVYELLAKQHLLDNTILVIVGDHGDSFGEHPAPGSWVHGNALYQEQIKVPLLFYQPKLFKPRVVNQITSSADITPTLLDAMKMNYDHQLVQGESLLSPSPKRKYVFVYGEENELAAIDQHNWKMQISFSKKRCQAYNLDDDPHEMRPLTCNLKEQETAIIKFHNFQSALLNRYNDRLPTMETTTQ